MKNDAYNKLRRKCWTNVGRRGGKNNRWGKRVVRARFKTWNEREELKEEKDFEKDIDNGDES